MDKIPVKDGSHCIFRVVRVSGTIRTVEEEAIRRARDLILRARRELGGRNDSTIDGIFSKDNNRQNIEHDQDFSMVDRSDSEEEDGLSDGDG